MWLCGFELSPFFSPPFYSANNRNPEQEDTYRTEDITREMKGLFHRHGLN